MHYKSLLFIFFLYCPFAVFAQQIRISDANQGNSALIDENMPYACYKGPETKGKAIFGLLNLKKGRFVALDKKNKQARRAAALKKKIENLRNRLNSQTKKSAKVKIKRNIKASKRGIKLIRRGNKLCKDFEPVKPPLPDTGPFSGNAYSLKRYHNDTLTPQECRHLLRRAAFGGNKDLLDICLNRGLEGVVEALLAFEIPPALEKDAEVFTFTYIHPDSNVYYQDGSGNKIDFYLVGQMPSEKFFEEHLLPLLLEGNPLREWLTYQLMDWFAVDVGSDNCNNTSGDLHKNCIYPYHKLYHDNALNFSSSEPLAGTFETLLHRQVNDVAMQFWLNNTNNCSNNGQRTNQNFGRELLELFALGTEDLHGTPTYDNKSVITASEAASGYRTVWNGQQTFFDHWTCSPFQGSKSLFTDSPWGQSAAFTINNPDLSQHYSELVRGILYKHPQSPVYIAGQFFSRLIHQNLSADSSSDLLLAEASDLIMSTYKYHIGSYIENLLKSQAMFSKASLRSGIATPTDTFVRLMRLLEIPSVDRGVAVSFNWIECVGGVNDPDPLCKDNLFTHNNKPMKIARRGNGSYSVNSQWAGKIPSVAQALRYALRSSGDLPGHPESVFGRAAGTAGKWRGSEVHKGHDALTPQLLLERINGLSRVLYAADPNNVVTDLNQKFAYDPRNETPYRLREKFSVNDKTLEEIVKLFEEILDIPLSSGERQVMLDYLGDSFHTLSDGEKETRMRGLVMLFYQHGLFLLG